MQSLQARFQFVTRKLTLYPLLSLVYAYCYWTGLLLLVRAALYIIAAVNVSNGPGINLLAIGFTIISILLLKGCLKKNKIYKKWPLELIEMISYINLTFSV